MNYEYEGYSPLAKDDAPEVFYPRRDPLPDDGCITLPDGSCVGYSGCMHDPRTDIGGEA